MDRLCHSFDPLGVGTRNGRNTQRLHSYPFDNRSRCGVIATDSGSPARLIAFWFNEILSNKISRRAIARRSLGTDHGFICCSPDHRTAGRNCIAWPRPQKSFTRSANMVRARRKKQPKYRPLLTTANNRKKFRNGNFKDISPKPKFSPIDSDSIGCAFGSLLIRASRPGAGTVRFFCALCQQWNQLRCQTESNQARSIASGPEFAVGWWRWRARHDGLESSFSRNSGTTFGNLGNEHGISKQPSNHSERCPFAAIQQGSNCRSMS